MMGSVALLKELADRVDPCDLVAVDPRLDDHGRPRRVGLEDVHRDRGAEMRDADR